MGNLNRFRVGDSAEFKHTVTSEDIQRFADLTGDDNPLHVDREFAEKTSFKGIVAHGMLGASFISTIIGKHIPGEGALWVSHNLDFLLPVRIGDELTIYAEIIQKHERQRLLTLKTEIRNQYRQIVVSGECKVKVLELEAPEQPKSGDADGKVALVTGASRGIGAATAIYLAKQGYCVAINYRADEAGAERVQERILQDGGKAMLCKADVTDERAVQDMVDNVVRRFGTVTALVNNATSRIIPQEFETLEWQDIQRHLDIQVKGAFLCMRAVIKEFLKNRKGSVVNLGTIYSDSTPPLKLTGYVLAKNSLFALTKSLAAEYGPKGLRFNLVSPGMTDTGLISEVPEKTRLMTAMQTPLRRIARPDDVARAIAFLLSDAAEYITGETVRVCGGQVMI